MDFDEWMNRNYSGAFDMPHPREAYQAGQQSKQAEVDALQKRINELTKWAEFHIEDYNPSESDSEHDRGWFSAACQVLRKLKGEQQ